MIRFQNKSKIFQSLCLITALSSSLFSSHNASRYLPFLEKPEDYITHNKSFIAPALFITNASRGYNRGGGALCGLPELYGKYDLNDVIKSVAAAKQEEDTYNPFIDEPGYIDLKGKSIKFHLEGKVKSMGIILGLEQRLFKTDFSAGLFIPIMKLNTSLRSSFDRENSDPSTSEFSGAQVGMLDRVRRSVHKELGLVGDDWVKTGVGDLDLHLRWHHVWDHVAKMRTIDLGLQGGVVCPTGTKRDKNYPSSVPFMGNGHWSVYGDAFVELELKQNWKLGGIFGLMDQFAKTQQTRIPHYKEPELFSAIVGNFEVDPGLTMKLSPYFTLENISDGLNVQLRYTFLRHLMDHVADKRADHTVKSYLDYTSAEKSDIGSVRADKGNLTKWTSHYLSFELVYDSVEAMKHWTLKPTFYAVYDYPLGGLGASKTHQFTLGVMLHAW